MLGKMAIIGDGDSILVFSSVGIDSFSATGNDVSALIKKLAKSYQIIFVTDVIAKEYSELINNYLNQPYPIIISIPSKEGSNGFGEECLKNAMDKALGVDILFNKNNDKEDGQ